MKTGIQGPAQRAGRKHLPSTTLLVAYGYIGDRLHALAYVRRDTNIRVVSLRKANDREQGRYDAS